jgi:subtilisin family serine protease
MPLNISSSETSDKDIAMAIRYAVDNGAQVINMSFGKGSPCIKNGCWRRFNMPKNIMFYSYIAQE